MTAVGVTRVLIMTNFDSKVIVQLRADVVNEGLRYKGFGGNERGISEIKMQIKLVIGQWSENKRPPFLSILRCIRVLLMGLFRAIG